MMIHLLKFTHLLFAISLLCLVLYCFVRIQSTALNVLLFGFTFCAMLTGTLLVYPKHFTFHTPWIQAAYLLVIVFSLFLLLQNKIKNAAYHRWFFLFFFIILIIVVHDAVTKTTFVF